MIDENMAQLLLPVKQISKSKLFVLKAKWQPFTSPESKDKQIVKVLINNKKICLIILVSN